jgi:hypothetical protein
MSNLLEVKYNNALEEYKESRENFIQFVTDEVNTSCFERNAITRLAIMIEQKARMEALRVALKPYTKK